MNPEYIREQLDRIDLLPDKEKEAPYNNLYLELLTTAVPCTNFYYCLRELEEHYDRFRESLTAIPTV